MAEEADRPAPDEFADELARLKELKVEVSTDLYLKLHQHKILSGTLLRDIVASALEDYLEDLATDDQVEAGDAR